MSRLKKRLQIYVLFCILLIATFWLFVQDNAKNAETPAVKRQQPLRRRSPVQEPKTSQEDLSWLTKTFKKTDTTFDKVLSLNELTWSIHKTVGQHVRQAMMSNPRTFFGLDKINHNGQVEWNEWLAQFYKKYNVKSEQDMDRSVKEKLAAAKAAWSEAARSNPDALNIDEFLSFSHPESSHSALAQQMEEMIGRHDDDGDGVISLNEYLDDPFVDFTPEELETRKKRFKELDADGNSRADRREILTFLDPKQVAQAKEEALRLITMADNDADGFLSWPEVEEHAKLFLDSKWISPERAFHWDL